MTKKIIHANLAKKHSPTLNNHTKMIHEHKCEFCVMTFAKSFYLKLHMKSVHKGQNLDMQQQQPLQSSKIVTSIADLSQIDFKCNECEDSFVCAQDLKWHIDNIHEDLKKTENNEEIIQEGEKSSDDDFKNSEYRWKCHTCGKNYTQDHKLKFHIRTVHDEIRQYTQLYANTFIHSETNKMMYKM